MTGCPFGALEKNEWGAVTWDSSRCIGCRYCEVACPFEVPKFEWDKWNPKIVKCEFCFDQRLKKDQQPACTAVCPTGAVIFGKRDGSSGQAKERIAASAGQVFREAGVRRARGRRNSGAVSLQGRIRQDRPPQARPDLAGSLRHQSDISDLQMALGPILIAGFSARRSSETGIATRPRDLNVRNKQASRINYERTRYHRLHSGQPLAARRSRLSRAGDYAHAAFLRGAGRARSGSGHRAVLLSARSFSGMNDVYAWGIWKTFNVLTLTALGSGPLAVGMAAWVFNRQKLHVVMRTALVSGFLFYATGLIALGFDVGRPWNFCNILLPWRWNTESAMLEVSVCMPLYCTVFLAFENLPHGSGTLLLHGQRRDPGVPVPRRPLLRRIYPFMITGAYVLPLMHQSSLGGLMLLAGDKIHPLWQTPFLPLLYLLAAGLCGLGFVIFLLLIACLRYSRALDLDDVLGELGNLLSWICFLFLAVRFGTSSGEDSSRAAFALDKMSLLFLFETALILIPAVALRSRAARGHHEPCLTWPRSPVWAGCSIVSSLPPSLLSLRATRATSRTLPSCS